MAKALLEGLAAEEKWDEVFAGTQNELATLADEALAEFEQGKTMPLEESLYDKLISQL